MSLATLQETPFIAEKDIVVFKILNKDLSAVHQNFQYKLNELYTTTIARSKPRFFSYDDTYKYRAKSNVIFYGQGFHSFLDLETAKSHNHSNRFLPLCIVRCIIPKGSEYYTNLCNYAISNQLKVVEVVVKPLGVLSQWKILFT